LAEQSPYSSSSPETDFHPPETVEIFPLESIFSSFVCRLFQILQRDVQNWHPFLVRIYSATITKDYDENYFLEMKKKHSQERPCKICMIISRNQHPQALFKFISTSFLSHLFPQFPRFAFFLPDFADDIYPTCSRNRCFGFIQSPA
jgi:hypothetical protein